VVAAELAQVLLNVAAQLFGAGVGQPPAGRVPAGVSQYLPALRDAGLKAASS
jgi:hypothetical protein